MSYNVLQLSPQASTRVSSLVENENPWGVAFEGSPRTGFGPYSVEDDLERSGINWGAVSGLAIAVAFSAAFWSGVALIVERVWR